MIDMKVWWAKTFYSVDKDSYNYIREDGLFRPNDHKDKYSSLYQKDKDKTIEIIEMRQINHDIDFKKDII